MRYQPLLQQQLIPHRSKLERFATVIIITGWVTFARSDICTKRHLQKATFAQSDICTKQHLRKATFVRSDNCAKQHLCEAAFAWSDICVKWHFPKALFARKTLVRSDEVTLAWSRPLLLGDTCKVASTTSPSLAPRWPELHSLLSFTSCTLLAHESL